MRLARHPLLVALFALLLVAGQQAALAHMLGHAAASAAAAEAVEVAHGGDADHGAALSLSHACTTCLAFAGADGVPPAAALAAFAGDGGSCAPAVAVSPAPTLRFVAAFRSRAPPLL